MSTLNGKERLRAGKRTGPGDETGGKEITRQVNELLRQGVSPADAFAAAVENARGRIRADFS